MDRAVTRDEVRARVRRAIEAEAARHAAHLARLRRLQLQPGRLDDSFDVPIVSTRWPEASEAGRVRALEGRRRIRLVEKIAALRLGAPRGRA